MKKRGLSPVIATVLLVALVMVLATIIFLWAKGFISEQIEKFGQPVDEACADVDFEVNFILMGGDGRLEIVNRGNVPIHNFDVKQVQEGDSKIETFSFGVRVGEATPGQLISLEFDTEKIIVYPRVLGKVKGKKLNKPFTCIEQGKTIKL